MSDYTSIFYHDIFDYSLTPSELKKWYTPIKIENLTKAVKNKQLLIKKRFEKEKYSKGKLVMAKKASKILEKIPTIKFIGITGALAMNNADKTSDIDLMIITQKGTLWTTRLISYLVNWLIGTKIRKAGDVNEKDKLCLNMWLDENDLFFADHNLYTAHEIAQVVPLVNKDKIYERFLWKNRWILEYWPNSVKIRNPNIEIRNVSNFVLRALNLIAFKMQYIYMKSKITREVITKTRALFHPQDWGKVVLDRLKTDL